MHRLRFHLLVLGEIDVLTTQCLSCLGNDTRNNKMRALKGLISTMAALKRRKRPVCGGTKKIGSKSTMEYL